MNFSLPPDVSFQKTKINGYYTYIFRHTTLGEIGRIIVQPLPNGETNMVTEIPAGDDPNMEKRKAIFIPLSEEILGLMGKVAGKGTYKGKLPPRPNTSQNELVRNHQIPCEKCGQLAVVLIFPPHAIEKGHFEDYARKMYTQYRNWNVDTWIIGTPAGPRDGANTPTNILKVWPEKGELIHTTANEFNMHLLRVLDSHCSG
ncbi:MAG: hypothetical protein KTR26_17540 [Flammeovirgaceae bacterium]|nr:hypothetical protein [Flammeovirgaceae bacterium]